jgi:flavin reductase (DIM6/NTAB) family NADH-FMN oxidoreductase RutF
VEGHPQDGAQLSGRDGNAYQCFVSQLDNPMFILTVASEKGRAGCLVGFATQCSIDPPRWYVGVSKLNHTFSVAATATVAVLHALGATNVGLARLFGEQTGDDIDKFSLCQWREGPDGRSIVLSDCKNWFVGEIVDRLDPGDHAGLVLAPIAAECADNGPQLGFQALRDLRPGHPS